MQPSMSWACVKPLESGCELKVWEPYWATYCLSTGWFWEDQMVAHEGAYFGSSSFHCRSCKCSQEWEGDNEAFWKHGLRLCLPFLTEIQEGLIVSTSACSFATIPFILPTPLQTTTFPPTSSAQSFTPPRFLENSCTSSIPKTSFAWDLRIGTVGGLRRSHWMLWNQAYFQDYHRVAVKFLSQIMSAQWVQYQALSEIQLCLHALRNLVDLGCSAVALCGRK
jgi:hypothetical protein